MLFEETLIIKAPIGELWNFLVDPQSVGTCIPGCEDVQIIDDKNFLSQVKVKIGGISAKFRIRTTIKEESPPNHLVIVSRGEDVFKAGRLVQENIIDLSVLSDNETKIKIKSEVSIVGRLAKFGERIIRAKTKQMEKEFIEVLRKKIEI